MEAEAASGSRVFPPLSYPVQCLLGEEGSHLDPAPTTPPSRLLSRARELSRVPASTCVSVAWNPRLQEVSGLLALCSPALAT